MPIPAFVQYMYYFLHQVTWRNIFEESRRLHLTAVTSQTWASLSLYCYPINPILQADKYPRLNWDGASNAGTFAVNTTLCRRAAGHWSISETELFSRPSLQGCYPVLQTGDQVSRTNVLEHLVMRASIFDGRMKWRTLEAVCSMWGDFLQLGLPLLIDIQPIVESIANVIVGSCCCALLCTLIIYVSISPNTAILSILWGKAPACCRTCAIEWWDVCHFGCNAHNSQTWIWIILKLAWLLLYSLVTLFSLLLWPDRM